MRRINNFCSDLTDVLAETLFTMRNERAVVFAMDPTQEPGLVTLPLDPASDISSRRHQCCRFKRDVAYVASKNVDFYYQNIYL